MTSLGLRATTPNATPAHPTLAPYGHHPYCQVREH
jgi:hypothetical protein